MGRTLSHSETTSGSAEVDDSRTRLLRATTRLVRAHSFNSVGVKAICDLAGVHRGSFYHHFDSKQALMLEAVNATWDRFDSEALTLLRDATVDPRDRLIAFFDHLHQCHSHDKKKAGHVLGCMFGNLAAESTALDDHIRARLQRVFADWAAAIAQPLAEAQSEGAIDASVDVGELADQVLAAIQGLTLVAKITNDPDAFRLGGIGVVERIWRSVDAVAV